MKDTKVRKARIPEVLFKCPKCGQVWRMLEGDTLYTDIRCAACCERFMIEPNLTDDGHIALGHHKCGECGKWFEPIVKRQVLCLRCENRGGYETVNGKHGKRYPRADLMARGEESYEG